MKKAIVYTLLTLITALVICVKSAWPQSISVGVGVNSPGLTTVLLSGELKGHHIFCKTIQEYVNIVTITTPYTETHETVFGYGYTLATEPEIVLYVGVGTYHNAYIDKNIFGSNYYLLNGLQLNSFNCGFGYVHSLKKLPQLKIEVMALMSTYSKLSTFLKCTYKFKKRIPH